MATLFYTVFEGAAEVACGDPIQEGAVTIGGTSLDSSPISGTKRVRRRVRVFCDAKVASAAAVAEDKIARFRAIAG